jgi:hypothetical protein
MIEVVIEKKAAQFNSLRVRDEIGVGVIEMSCRHAHQRVRVRVKQ